MAATTRDDGREADRFEEAVDVLSDEYTCRILGALEDDAMPAVELAAACDVSRATVYRRLDRLEALGFVRSRLAYHEEGHHRKEFHLALDEIHFEVGEDGLGGSISLTGAAD